MDSNNFEVNTLNDKLELIRRCIPAEIRSYVSQLIAANGFNVQRVFQEFIAIESDRNVLKKELKFLIKIAYYYKIDSPVYKSCCENNIRFRFLVEKYGIQLSQQKCDDPFGKILMTFPDIAYNIAEKPPFNQINLPSTGYKNFKFSYWNQGLFSLLPAGQKFGGFAKASIHFCSSRIAAQFSVSEENVIDLIIDSSYILFKSTVTSQKKREIWFHKLNISAADCELWSQIFEQKFPNYTDIHERFDQVA